MIYMETCSGGLRVVCFFFRGCFVLCCDALVGARTSQRQIYRVKGGLWIQPRYSAGNTGPSSSPSPRLFLDLLITCCFCRSICEHGASGQTVASRKRTVRFVVLYSSPSPTLAVCHTPARNAVSASARAAKLHGKRRERGRCRRRAS